MTFLSKPLTFSMLFVLLLVNQAFAQSPQAFKYQAVVRDANHAPLTWQAVNIRLSILESSASGNIVFQESHAVTTSAIGLVSLNVGEGSSWIGNFADIDWARYQHFLQVEVDETGGSNYYVLGTSQLLSVPYALFAEEAATALDVDDADADSTNELQTLHLDGNNLSISQGNTVSLPIASFTAGDGISIDGDTITNLKPGLWQLDSGIVFVDTNKVAIGLNDTSAFPSDAQLFVDGNIRLGYADLLGVDEIIAQSSLTLSGNPSSSGDLVISNAGRARFEEEVGINQVFSFIDLNVRNQAGNATVFQVEDTSGSDLFEVGRTGNVGINQITNNVTLQVQNRDTTGGITNNIIANFERANGNNVLQIQDDNDVVVTGDFSVNSGNKNFILDHPLNPANKILAHNAVESPDHVTYYDGTVRLDAQGAAVVRLPDYFEALNTDYHYQLTCIGAFAQVYIAEEIQNNQFTLAGGQAGMKVSWQVSARRDDPWAHDHPYQAEEDKEPQDRGKYYYPEGYGKSEKFLIGADDSTSNNRNEEDQ